MSEKECLMDIRTGASFCLTNADRLIKDAEVLFQKARYLSSFLLSQFALEELAKGHMLIRKHLKKETFSKREWETLIKGRGAHLNKLAILQQIEEKWIGPDAYAKKGKQKEAALELYDIRYSVLYVNYDFEKKQWSNPPEEVIPKGIPPDGRLAYPYIGRAKLHSQLLAKLLKGETAW